MSDPRDVYIQQVVRGKSFVDVGGLWGTVNEKVSVAQSAGARSLAMIDVTPLGHELWQAFEERRQALRIPEVRCVSGDVQQLVESADDLQFDVVHCSGVLYHLPDPFRLLVALRKLAREYLILSSAVTATRVEGEAGVLDIPQAAALFVPALREREREIVRGYWQRFVGGTALGLTSDIPVWNPDDFGPWWWLPTTAALTALCETSGFHCEATALMWNNNAFVQLLAVRA